MTRGRLGRKAWRVGAVLLLIGVVLYPLLFIAFPAWQLRHTYDVWMGPFSKHKGVLDPFHRPVLLQQHKPTVRAWIEEDFLDPEKKVGGWRLLCVYNLLSSFGEREDLDILLRRAEIGFYCRRTSAQDDAHSLGDQDRAVHLASRLVVYTYGFCCLLAGSEAEGLALLRREYDARTLAPDVRTPYSRLLAAQQAAQDTASDSSAPLIDRTPTP